MMTKKHVAVILSIISVLAIAFFIRDWYVFYQCGAVEQCLVESSYFQHIAKFSVTTLITVMALFCGSKYCICKRDRRLLQMAMLCAFCADICFKILHNVTHLFEHSADYTLMGINFFMVFQSIFIYRHTRTSDTDEHVPWIIVIPFAVMFVFNALQLFSIFGSPLIPTVATYAAFLICSLIVACKVSKIGYFSARNAAIIKRGMILFFLGDVCVGLSLATGPDHSLQEIVATVANNFVWYFYVPALLCLVLSGYKRD